MQDNRNHLPCDATSIPGSDGFILTNGDLITSTPTAVEWINSINTKAKEQEVLLKEIYRIANNACYQGLACKYETAAKEICQLIRPLPVGSDEWHGDHYIGNDGVVNDN